MSLSTLKSFKKTSVIFDIIKENGGESRFVGGCVRDLLINKPIQDIDIATTLLPDSIEKIFRDAGYHTLDVGKKFGTIIVIIDGYQYEITTLRQDIETDGRRVVVEYTTQWDEDALRRDFTINAMSYAPDEDKLYDYFGGEEDLKNGTIRFVGDPAARVQEDFLRILRFFRFYTYFGKHSYIHQNSLEACVEYANKLPLLSGERKYAEFSKIISHPDRVETLELMYETKVLEHLFGYEISIESVRLLSDISKAALSHSRSVNNLILLFVILDNNGMSIKDISNLFKLAVKDQRYLESLNKISRDAVEKDSYKLLYKYKDIFCDTLLYLQKTSLLQELESILEKGLPEFPLRGQDIINEFNLAPGKQIGELMDFAENIWCQSKFVMDKAALLKKIKIK